MPTTIVGPSSKGLCDQLYPTVRLIFPIAHAGSLLSNSDGTMALGAAVPCAAVPALVPSLAPSLPPSLGPSLATSIVDVHFYKCLCLLKPILDMSIWECSASMHRPPRTLRYQVNDHGLKVMYHYVLKPRLSMCTSRHCLMYGAGTIL